MISDNKTIEAWRTLATRVFYQHAPSNVGFNLRYIPDRTYLVLAWKFKLAPEREYGQMFNVSLLQPREAMYDLISSSAENCGRQAAMTMQAACSKFYFGE